MTLAPTFVPSPALPNLEPTRRYLPPTPHPSGERPPRLPAEVLPRHVAIIMDGNGRWAAGRGLPRVKGHVAGRKALTDVLHGAVEVGIPYLSVFAFSTENWNRPAGEVRTLMQLVRKMFSTELAEAHAHGMRIWWAGREGRAPRDLIAKAKAAERKTADNTAITVTVCVNYGGRAEIADAARRIAAEARAGVLDPASVDEEVFGRYLHVPELPDVDLLIRTSGEQRISNFLLWQCSYAEFVFDDTLWPDFDRRNLWRAVEVYAARRRRFGGLDGQPGR